MNYKTHQGVTLPVLGIGSWEGNWGRDEIRNDPIKDKICKEAIVYAIQNGMTHIDTAELYGSGRSEIIIGEAINNFDRNKLFITSKVKGQNLHYDDVIKSCKDSIERLQTPYLDLYLIHWPNSEIPIKETMQALDYLVDNDLVKRIGVSNFSVEQMIEAQEYTKYKLLTNQVHYNFSERNNASHVKNVESEILPYCQNNDMFLMAYKPLALGKITEKMSAPEALKWLIEKPNVIAIFGSTNPNHIKENINLIVDSSSL